MREEDFKYYSGESVGLEAFQRPPCIYKLASITIITYEELEGIGSETEPESRFKDR